MERYPDKPRFPTPSPERCKELDERFSVDKDEFLVLKEQVGHRTPEGVWDMRHVAEEYVKSTDKIIGILDGSIEDRELADPDNKEQSKQAPDVVIYLDKSARPVSWFVDEFWDQMARKEEVDGKECPIKKPEAKFLNIDRADWLMRMKKNEGVPLSELDPTDFDINEISEDEIAQIRAIFAKGSLSDENWLEEVKNKPNYLDGKNVLIVDEVKSSGATLSIAQQLLKKAFPESTVSGAYFWQQTGRMVNGRLQMGIAPVWYDASRPDGRLVDDKNLRYYEKSYEEGRVSLQKKLGAVALSSPQLDTNGNRMMDGRARNLKKDIKHLAQACREGRVFRQLHFMRPDDDFDQGVEAQGLDVTDYRHLVNRKLETI